MIKSGKIVELNKNLRDKEIHTEDNLT